MKNITVIPKKELELLLSGLIEREIEFTGEDFDKDGNRQHTLVEEVIFESSEGYISGHAIIKKSEIDEVTKLLQLKITRVMFGSSEHSVNEQQLAQIKKYINRVIY